MYHVNVCPLHMGTVKVECVPDCLCVSLLPIAPCLSMWMEHGTGAMGHEMAVSDVVL